MHKKVASIAKIKESFNSITKPDNNSVQVLELLEKVLEISKQNQDCIDLINFEISTPLTEIKNFYNGLDEKQKINFIDNLLKEIKKIESKSEMEIVLKNQSKKEEELLKYTYNSLIYMDNIKETNKK